MKKQSWWERLLGIGNTTSSSAAIAKDRLTVLVASNNTQLQTRLTPDRIEQMKREIAAVVSRYVSGLGDDSININHRKEDSMDVLEMNISLPDLIKGVENESERLTDKKSDSKSEKHAEEKSDDKADDKADDEPSDDKSEDTTSDDKADKKSDDW